MMLIVAHHYVVNSGLLDVISVNPSSAKSIFLYLWGMWGKTGINCFVLITGYFMCTANITLRKFLKLLLEVEFYKVIIYALFIIFGYEEFSMKGCFRAMVPITNVALGFISCYLVFFLFIPFLNKMVQNLDKRGHLKLLLLCLITYTAMGTWPCFHVSFNYVTWFCVLYVIGSYIRLYGFMSSLTNSQWGWLSLLSVIVSMSSVLLFIAIGKTTLPYPYRLVQDSNTALAVVTAVCSFMYFKDLKIKQSKIINTVAASTFGVLLIHANSDTMRSWLWRHTLDNVGFYSTDYVYIHAIASVITVFFLCILIDYIRIHTLEQWAFKHIDKALVYHGWR